MTDNITVQITGKPEDVLKFLTGFKLAPAEPWWKTETPWFERHGKLAAEEAADLEAGTYGKSRT